MSQTVGFGLFAARDFAPGEFIFHEGPLIQAFFNETYPDTPKDRHEQASACIAALNQSGPELRAAYPFICRTFGRPPLPYEEAIAVYNGTLNKRLVHGQLQASPMTREEYDGYIKPLMPTSPSVAADPELAGAASATAGEDHLGALQAAFKFFRDYAFVDPLGPGAGAAAIGGRSGGTAQRAYIYLLGSLVNHCHTPKRRDGGPNCEFRIGRQGLAKFALARHISVRARRAIPQGAQLTWDYGKRDDRMSFRCECETCNSAWTRHLRRALP